MAEETEIEWCDSTFNPFIGCTKVGPGCDNCYAEELMDKRMHIVQWGPGQQRHRTGEKNWNAPVRWERDHVAFFAEHGRRRRVFCASLADVFDNEVDPAWRDDLFHLIEKTPNLDWLILTKRIGNVGNMLPVPFDFDRLYPNVWLGATVVNQAEADRDIPKLLAVPARVRFLSIEPMLGPVDVRKFMWPVHPVWPAKFRSPEEAIAAGAKVEYRRQALVSAAWADHMLSWVIAGGESGPKARPSHPDWYRSLRDRCAAAGVPFLFKQWGEYSVHEVGPNGEIEPPSPMTMRGLKQWRADLARYSDAPKDAMVSEVFAPGMSFALPIGKKAAGRLLDGIEHNGYPEVSHG